MSKQKEWVFLAKDNRPYFYKDGWLYWWHPDKRWVTHQKISDFQSQMLINNLSLYEQSIYFKDSDYKPDWYTELDDRGDFCKCGQVKHVGFDECIDCHDESVYGSSTKGQ